MDYIEYNDGNGSLGGKRTAIVKLLLVKDWIRYYPITYLICWPGSTERLKTGTALKEDGLYWFIKMSKEDE